MTRAYIRHIAVAVVLAAAIAGHWFGAAATSELQPLAYVLALLGALVWVTIWMLRRRRQQPA